MINLKLGDGKNKYKIKFKYIETGRTTIKNVYADSIEEAMKLFNEEYKDFKIEIISTEQLEEGDSMEEKCCNKCGSDYEEEYYKYNNKIYCFNCLIDELESSGQMIVVRTTHYYNDDWGQLGTDDDIDETVKNICEEFDVEEVKQ